MWPYPQKKQNLKWRFFCKVAVFSLVLHIVFLFTLFVLYRGNTFDVPFMMSVPLRRPGAKVVFLPFQKHVRQVVAGSKVAAKSVSGRFVKKSVPRRVVKKKTTISKSVKQTVAKPVIKKNLIAKQKEEVKKTQKEKKDRFSVNKKSEQQKKKEMQKKALEKKEQEKKKELAKKLEKQKKEQPKTLEPKKLEKDVPKKAEPAKTKEQEKEVGVINEPVADHLVDERDGPLQKSIQSGQEDVVYMGRYDIEALHAQELLQEAIQSVWKMPVGMPSGTSCELKVTIDWRGSAHSIEMSKSSNIRMFDVAARTAASRTSYPKMFYGKTVSINF
ncbi:hypothetical protein HN446_01425 [bacterium]|jgi:outer membrane biosynthesis protein TonB|nr:hypothetical protein [bacterium]